MIDDLLRVNFIPWFDIPTSFLMLKIYCWRLTCLIFIPHFLYFFREANQKLQDTNDGLVQMVDESVLRSPRVSKRNSRRGSQSGSESDSLPSRHSSIRLSGRLRVPEPQFGTTHNFWPFFATRNFLIWKLFFCNQELDGLWMIWIVAHQLFLVKTIP